MSHNYCPHFKAALTTTTETGQKLAVAGRCKQWTCKFCARKNRDKWTAVLLDHINHSEKNWSWFTLTAHRNAHRSPNPARYTLLNVKQAWDRLMKRMRRKYGHFEYCRIYEKHESGAFHVHCIRAGHFDDIVTRNRGKKFAYKDSKWLRITATNLGLGFMTHADNIEATQKGVVVFYVVKYMTKIDTANGDDWRGVRRIQTSRGIKYNQPSQYKWDFRSGLYLSDLDDNGDNYFLLNEKRQLSNDDFVDEIFWPPDNEV